MLDYVFHALHIFLEDKLVVVVVVVSSLWDTSKLRSSQVKKGLYAKSLSFFFQLCEMT